MQLKRTRTKQTGSMILEALIAILIFSMGILALVGMQAQAINNVADAKYRSTAGFLADQMVGTMWATSTSIINASNVMTITPDPAFACNPCSGAAGNAYTQAWATSVAAALPNATGANAPIIAIAGPLVTITIAWQPPNTATTHKHVVSTYIN